MQRVFSVVVLALFLGTTASAICLYPRPRLLCAEYFQEEAVVTAKFLKIRHVTLSDDDYLVYTMQTERVLRGKMRAIFRLIDDPYTHRALFPEKGQRYLLFLSYNKDLRAWALDDCGSSGPLAESADILKGIDQLQGQHGGTIQGVASLDAVSTVLVRGKQHTFRTTTNDQGEFEVHVPAGEYSVSVVHKGKRFEPDPLSYEDPKKLRVRNGGCAQVQFDLIE
jgi:hypothetical protein